MEHRREVEVGRQTQGCEPVAGDAQAGERGRPLTGQQQVGVFQQGLERRLLAGLQGLGLSKLAYGGAMAFGSVLYILGTIACRRLLVRWDIRRTVFAAGFVTFGAGALMAALAWFGWGQPWYGVWAVVLPQYLFIMAHGVHQPVGQSGAVAPFPQMAGAASALNGFVMMASAFPMGLWLGRAMDGTPRPAALGFLLWCTVIAVTAWTLVQKHGDTGQH